MKYKKIRGPVLTQCAINRSFKKEKEEKELGFFFWGGGRGEYQRNNARQFYRNKGYNSVD